MFGFSELEEALLGDKRQAVLAEALSSVRTIHQEALAAIDSGLSSDDFEAAPSIVAAAKAAENILLTPLPKSGTKI